MTDNARVYGGRAAAERVAERRGRLLAAGLELMGTRGVAGTTVRGVAEQSGIAARYFYESFAGIEELQLAVFDQIAAEAAERSVAALGAAPGGVRARTRAVLAAMADLFLEDPRKGRIALIESITSPVLGPRVLDEARRFAGMLAATTTAGDPSAAADDVPVELLLTARFLIGGVAHALGAALQGDVAVDRERLVDVLVELFLAVDLRR
ncbi:TetR/AcrR family transcriptional regulator [Pimelobacter simplex]|uniref:TetR/AcrR family transcriptional regulator n=1 Tax=Nocardioides simplex TaxID=2045 RepID=UPI00214FCABD|nr:TetR family transcriptional regulator [Pimelobacter simplex]UUW91230.1 TetR family transcriptional regulator [Pimelobacter simplex]UUW95058.1 TetR family transcriptional regulator [Pimelobacter simplex]